MGSVSDPSASARRDPALGWSLVLAAPLRGSEPPSPSPHEILSRRVQEVLETPGYQEGHWGILVVDGKTGQTVYERNADQLFAPASVTKLFSTAAALIELGPNHRFQTPLVRHGEVDVKGTLHGDLILVAQGDLCLGGRTGPDGSLVFKDEDHTYPGAIFGARSWRRIPSRDWSTSLARSRPRGSRRSPAT